MIYMFFLSLLFLLLKIWNSKEQVAKFWIMSDKIAHRKNEKKNYELFHGNFIQVIFFYCTHFLIAQQIKTELEKKRIGIIIITDNIIIHHFNQIYSFLCGKIVHLKQWNLRAMRQKKINDKISLYSFVVVDKFQLE